MVNAEEAEAYRTRTIAGKPRKHIAKRYLRKTMQMDIPIDKGIPLPPRRHRPVARYYGNTAARLEVGDSFLIRSKSLYDVHGLFRYWKDRNNATYAARMVDDGVRVWRVK